MNMSIYNIDDVYMCDDCGAVINLQMREKHERFHKLVRLLEADMRHRDDKT